MDAVRNGFRQQEAAKARQESQHLEAKHDHDGAGDDGEQSVGFGGKRQGRAERTHRTAQQRVGDDAPGIEIQMRLEALDAREVGTVLVVGGGRRDQ